jgi:hypothetical protein
MAGSLKSQSWLTIPSWLEQNDAEFTEEQTVDGGEVATGKKVEGA